MPISANANAGKESQDQTDEIFRELLGNLDISDEIDFESWRIPPKSGSTAAPSMIVHFKNESDKSNFFKSLPNLRDLDYQIQVHQNYPFCLKDRLKELANHAKNERKKPGKRTAIRYQKSDLKLYVKSNGGPWKITEY